MSPDMQWRMRVKVYVKHHLSTTSTKVLLTNESWGKSSSSCTRPLDLLYGLWANNKVSIQWWLSGLLFEMHVMKHAEWILVNTNNNKAIRAYRSHCKFIILSVLKVNCSNHGCQYVVFKQCALAVFASVDSDERAWLKNPSIGVFVLRPLAISRFQHIKMIFFPNI